MSAFKSDHNLVRDYIVAQDHLQYSLLPEDVVCIHMTHSNLPAKHLDIRLNLHMTISAVKERFRLHIGTPIDYQRLILKDDGHVVRELSDNARMLGFYSVTSGMEIHIIDTDPYSLSRGGGLTDTTLIEKYRMTDEEYDKKTGTMRDFIRKKREQDPNYKLKPKKTTIITTQQGGDNNQEGTLPPGIESVEGILIGDRCQINPGKRRGVVKFIGEVAGLKSGYWVGVHFDEPVGINDGSVKGEKIFESLPSHGSFVRGMNVATGNYPERDLLASDDEDDEGEAEVDHVHGENSECCKENIKSEGSDDEI